MNKIVQQHVIQRERLNEEHYFQAVLQQIENKKLLTDKELENIKMQCIQLLSKQTERYTGGESSSVTVEKAQSIMLSIFYCIGIYLKSLKDADSCIIELRGRSIEDLFDKGRSLIDGKVKASKELLDAVRKNCLDTNNVAYNGTIGEGMTSFFSLYNADFDAHDKIILIDYPLCNDKMNLVGVECIYSYLYKLLLENQFCSNYSSEAIHHVLHGYNEHYEELLINIFERILTNALGKILAGKTAEELNIYSKELQYLQHKLEKQSADQLEVLLEEATEKLFKELNIINTDLRQYISSAIRNISQNLYNALKNKRLETVFISYKESSNIQTLQFEDGLKMDDELFRKIADEIRECRFVSDKTALIQKNIHSIIDLIDIFEGTCIFDEEFYYVFSTLGDMELSLLLKTITINKEADTEYEEEWQNKLIRYVDEINLNRGKQIKLLCDTIKIS